MMDAHAGLLNGARCVKKKEPLVGWDDCEKWSTLENVVIEGGGTIDGNGEHWLTKGRDRPMLLDLLWIDGLTIRDLKIRRPGFWTVHPTFCNNVRVTGLDVYTRGKNTDGIDPDSVWNMYLANNTFDNGDDCIAIKSGRDWSGIMVNISTSNILAERNVFRAGHGVSIGSETSGWVTNVTIRDSILQGTQRAVRIKSCRGRGGGVDSVLYQNLQGSAGEAISLTLDYSKVAPTNITATPVIRNIAIRDLRIEASESFMDCTGLDDSVITGVAMRNVTVLNEKKQGCGFCKVQASDVTPTPCGSHSIWI